MCVCLCVRTTHVCACVCPGKTTLTVTALNAVHHSLLLQFQQRHQIVQLVHDLGFTLNVCFNVIWAALRKMMSQIRSGCVCVCACVCVGEGGYACVCVCVSLAGPSILKCWHETNEGSFCDKIKRLLCAFFLFFGTFVFLLCFIAWGKGCSV